MNNFTWWLRNILHIETIFYIIIIIILIYIFFFKKKSFLKNGAKTRRQRSSFASPAMISEFTDIFGDFERDFVIDPRYYKKEKRVNKHEEKCREIFENVFRVKFKSIRPAWLKNPVTNSNLELDGYNETIKTRLGQGLAFEYDGIQHSQYSPHFHKGNKNEFVYQTKKDAFKDMKCKEHGILLIRIPHYIDYHDLDRFIRQKLEMEKLL